MSSEGQNGGWRSTAVWPLSNQQIEDVVSEIEAEVYRQYDTEVPSSAIGELLMARLRELDQVAYVRFASVYREFKDVSEFMDEVQPMLEESKELGVKDE